MEQGLSLSRRETAELTRSRQRKRQILFLCKNGISHFVDTQGWPVVLRRVIQGAPPTTSPEGWRSNKVR